MNVLEEWLGKTDNLSISYDAGIQQTQALPGNINFGENLPAILYPEIDNIRDVANVTWDKAVSAHWQVQ